MVNLFKAMLGSIFKTKQNKKNDLLNPFVMEQSLVPTDLFGARTFEHPEETITETAKIRLAYRLKGGVRTDE